MANAGVDESFFDVAFQKDAQTRHGLLRYMEWGAARRPSSFLRAQRFFSGGRRLPAAAHGLADLAIPLATYNVCRSPEAQVSYRSRSLVGSPWCSPNQPAETLPGLGLGVD